MYKSDLLFLSNPGGFMVKATLERPVKTTHKVSVRFEKGDDMLTIASSLLAGSSSNRHHTLIVVDPPIETEDHSGKHHKRTHFKMVTDQIYRNPRNQSLVMIGRITSLFIPVTWDVRIKIVKREERMDATVTILHKPN